MPDMEKYQEPIQDAAREVRSAIRRRDHELKYPLSDYDEASSPEARFHAALSLISATGDIEQRFTRTMQKAIGKVMIAMIEGDEMPIPEEMRDELMGAIERGEVQGFIDSDVMGLAIGMPAPPDDDEDPESRPFGDSTIDGIDPDFVQEPERPNDHPEL